MTSFLVTSHKLALSGIVMLLLALVAGFQNPTPTYARIVSCRGDPKVTLSNGKRIVVAETISTTKSNVSSISYTFHLPAGVKVTRISKSDTGIAAKEIIKFYNDSPANTYTTDVLVKVTTSPVALTGKMSIRELSMSASGITGQELLMTLLTK